MTTEITMYSKGELTKCSDCKWAHPDVCRVCDNRQNKVLVLAVNKEGIKR